MACYVVTGGAGFIGSHLADALLAGGHQVRVIDDLSTGHRRNVDPRSDLTVGDVSDPRLVRRVMQGADGCFHLAAVSSVVRANEDWIGTHRTNQGGTVTVLDAARAEGGLPVVYASSAAVYGDAAAERHHEGLAPRPLSAYGADKLGSELHARVAFLVHGVPTLGLRFFNIYGPRQDPLSPYSGVISLFAERVAAGQPIRVDGDGEQTRDFVYVADVVRHLLAGMARLRTIREARVLNVCTGRASSILELADTLGRVAGRPPGIVHAAPRPGDVRASLGDPAAARAILDVAAATTLAEGLAAMLRCLERSR